MPIYHSILDTIGNTPMVKLQKLAPAHVNLYVKIEAFNPMGSVKDRMARAVIVQAEHSGELKPGQTVIESTSGNTGIGLAMVCAQKGYPLVVTMSESFSLERRRMLRYLGAKVVLTPASSKGSGMVRKAEELAEKHGYFLCRQFENQANADVHTTTTAREIIRDLDGRKLDYFVSGYGTGGTIQGVARGLKNNDARVQVIAAEPDNSPVLASGIPQPKTVDGSISGSHPQFRPHLMQGWAPDFISKLTEAAVNSGLVDKVAPVGGDRALALARQLATEEGIFVGISSGATLAAALDLAATAAPGSTIVCMLPDTGERYMSTQLFEDIEDDMNGEELALSESTISSQFLNAQPIVNQNAGSVPLVNSDVEQKVIQWIAEEPIVLFALEWCEFCWAARKLFSAMGLKILSVDLDSVAFQKDDLGVEIRPVLAKLTGETTIPQIFVAGKHFGGASDLFSALENGQLVHLLNKNKIEFAEVSVKKAAEFLPVWLHPRKSA